MCKPGITPEDVAKMPNVVEFETDTEWLVAMKSFLSACENKLQTKASDAGVGSRTVEDTGAKPSQREGTDVGSRSAETVSARASRSRIFSAVPQDPVQRRGVHGKVGSSIVPPGQFSVVQCSRVRYSTVRYSGVQYSQCASEWVSD